METGKPGLASAPVHISSVAAQTERSMDIQAPLTAVYIHAMPALQAQPYPQPPAATREPTMLHLAMPSLYSKDTLPFLTLHIASGLQSQPGLSLAAAAAVAPAARPKSAGKHVCPHCGRDCMKPSVLEKHLRCHTGERPYPCVTCGVSFKTQSNLYKHKRTQAHARLSSESELGSLDSSMSSSRETCASSLSLDESGSVERDASLPAADLTSPTSTAKVYSVKTHGSISEQLTPAGQETEASAKVTIEGDKQRMGNETPPATASRHLPLQRQEATLFSKQWESSVSRGKSQSHESTDSGFSESSDHYPSPGSVLPDHSMDSLTESTKEHLEETASTHTTPSGPGQEPKSTAREQEQKLLEERISKLISENTAVVEDKQLENVRPRKTVLSKQGSIDLPMPYTYKDSFHFDMRINKTPNVGLQRNRRDLYSSVPSQQSNTMEHAPLTRSNSLPFSVTLLQPERSSPTSPYQSDYVTLVRRGSSGQINPTGFAMKPVNQHSSTHRPLVRQAAVDGNHATDGLVVNSSVEEASGFGCDGDGGDVSGEPSNRKFRRKKSQKFAYNKWYMYGGGTFKKLYSAEKGGDDGVGKGRKCQTNSEQEVAQGLARRSSAVHKETVTTTTNFTSSSSSTAVCHGCPPTKLSLVSAADFNLKTSKTPLRRNLSLSVLPLSSIGSLVSHQTDSMSRVEAGRMIDEEKHTDSTLQLCGAHIPSDRKKQKTDDKIICPLGMQTDPNTPTHPRPSVAGSAPHQDTNLTYINLQNPKHTQLKAALFPTCIINANAPSVSGSPATSTPSAAKASFLPKYQLKLPNAAEPDSPHAVDKPAGSDGHSSHTEPPLVKTSDTKCGDPVTSPSTQICDIKNTHNQLPLPCTATTLCQVDTTRRTPNATSSLTVVCRQHAATTVTTTCLRNDQAGLCSASIQPSKSAGSSAPVQLPRPAAPVVTHFPATPSITTASNQSSAVTAFSQLYSNHTRLSSTSEQPSPVNNSPVVPCHIVPFDQPDAQNVFHVQTADLQICLQIISDEQLALIEPQIERHVGSGLSQRRDVDPVALEGIQNKSVTMESSEDGRDRRQETLKPPQSGKEEPNFHLTELSNSTQSTAESTPPEGSSLRPHKYGHVNTVTVTQSSMGDVMPTAASPEGVNSETSEEELSVNRCAEDRSQVSRGGLISQTLSGQHKLGVTSLSPSSVNHNSTRGERLGKNQAAQCDGGTMKAMGEETRPPPQVEPDELSGSSSSINTCKQLNPHASIDCSNPLESTLSETLDSSKHVGCDGIGPPDDPSPSQETSPSDSQDVITSEKQQFIPVSSNIQVERPKDIPVTSIQSPTAGPVERRAAQKEPPTPGHGETPEQPDSTDWRSKQSQEAGNTNLQCMEGRGGGGGVAVVGEDTSGGIKVPGWRDQAESDCTYTCLPHMTAPEGEDRTVKVDSFKNSWLSEQHLQPPSQTHSGMSVYPPQSHPPAPSTSTNLGSSAGCSHAGLEMNNFYYSHQHWDHSSIQQTHILCESNSSQRITAQTENAFSHIQSGAQQTFPHPDQKQGPISAGNNIPSGETSPSDHHSHVSQVSRAAAGSTASNNNVLDNNNTMPPTEPFTYPEPGDYHDAKDKAPNDFNKYQSFFLSGQLHGYQPPECLTGAVRPVQSCQDYTEDTSSSDDEGKLIIEL